MRSLAALPNRSLRKRIGIRSAKISKSKYVVDQMDARPSFLCRSASRSEKEKAMHERFSQHIEEGLQSLGRRIEKSKKALDRGQLERQIGRLLGQNSRAAARYSISLLRR